MEMILPWIIVYCLLFICLAMHCELKVKRLSDAEFSERLIRMMVNWPSTIKPGDVILPAIDWRPSPEELKEYVRLFNEEACTPFQAKHGPFPDEFFEAWKESREVTGEKEAETLESYRKALKSAEERRKRILEGLFGER